ncbi:MAG: CDP-2,3-bis-(O-geranylgeranyl)-sn-glycerol synthase [Candidatus Alkanophagales archaeon]
MFMVIAEALWTILPAYAANGAAAFFGGSLGMGRTPMDLGRRLLGERILGDGKTFEGFLTGVACGVLVGLLQTLLECVLNLGFGAGSASKPTFGEFPQLLVVLTCLSCGAMLGDAAGSFLKRRLRIKRGEPLPVVDQLDFVLGAMLLTFLLARRWFLASFTPPVILWILVLTPPIHLATNYVAFKLGRKGVPW